MGQNILAFCVLVALSAFCWVLVVNPVLRRKLSTRSSILWRLSKQDREDSDAIWLAGSLVGATVFSLVTIVFLVVGISRRMNS